MGARKFRSFDIQIVRQGDSFVVIAEDPSGRRTKRALQLCLNEWQVKYYISEALRSSDLVRRGSEQRAEMALKDLGLGLYSAIFPDEIGQWLDTALDDRSTDLRLRLDLTEAEELARLPWECLYHPHRQFYLALSRDMALVRRFYSPEPAVAMQVDPPLRILGMACSPKDLKVLQVERERTLLEENLAGLKKAGMVEIDWLHENTLPALAKALNVKTYHVFHFVGHGVYAEQEGQASGMLAFENASGNADMVSAEHLATILRRSAKLAVINACDGARGGNDPSTGVASSLLWQGIPAVIAMQFEISDVAAVRFSSDFYGGIAIGLPVDAAVTMARCNMMATNRYSAEWATPVLFMRSADGQIFQIGEPPKQDPEAAQYRETVVLDIQRNLAGELDWSQVPAWVQGSPSDWDENSAGATDELYRQALVAMQREQWESAKRLFKMINERSPGYRDIAQRWREADQQAELAKEYKRLVDAYGQGNWNKVVESYGAISRLQPDYKDSAQLCAEAQRQIRASHRSWGSNVSTSGGSSPEPTNLSGSQLQPDKPSMLPGEKYRTQPQRPPTLPGEKYRSKPC